MDKTFLQEAFKALDILNEEDFNLSSSEDIEDLKSFTDEDTSIMDIDVIDPDVTEEDELQDDYVGKVILDCDVCHSKIYKDPDQIVFSDDSEVVNIEDECPFCYSNDGYKIIGMVSAFDKADIDDTVEVEDNIETDDTVEVEDEENMDEGILGTVGGIFGGPLGAIGGSIADGVISKVNSSKKNESLDDTNCKDESCKDGKCEDMDELPPRNRERVKRKPYKDKDVDEGCNKQMQRRKLRKNVKEGFNNVSIETDDQVLDMNTEDNGKVTITTEPKRNKDTQKEIITPVSDDIQSRINPELDMDAEEEIDVNSEEIDVNPEEFDERSFDRIGESYLKEHYSNIKSLKTSNVTINGNKMIVECVITFTSNNKKKTKFIFESHSINKRGRVKFIGKNKQLNANEQFTLIGRLRNNTLINESLTANTVRKPLRRKSITEGKEIFHNDNGIDYTVIERSISGKNALLNKGKQWIVAWDCPMNNEGSWGQGHYFFDESDAREVWEDKYLYESRNSKRHKRINEMRNSRRRRLMRESILKKNKKKSLIENIDDIYMATDELEEIMENTKFGKYDSYQLVDNDIVKTIVFKDTSSDSNNLIRYWKFKPIDKGVWYIVEILDNRRVRRPKNSFIVRTRYNVLDEIEDTLKKANIPYEVAKVLPHIVVDKKYMLDADAIVKSFDTNYKVVSSL